MFVGGRRLGAAVVAALVLSLGLGLGLAGCSGSSDSPRSLPPLSTTPAATQSSVPTQDPKAAAVAVVREYFRLLNNLEQRMDGSAFSQIETTNCSCRKFIRSLRQVKSRGQHYFGHAKVTGLTAVVDTDRLVEVLTSYDSTAGGIKDAGGRVVSRQPGRTGVTENFYVREIDGRWVVDSIVLVRRGVSR